MKIRCLLLGLACLLLFSSCGRSDSVISLSETTKATLPTQVDPKYCLFVNVSAKKIHYQKDCRYLKRSNEENITRMDDTETNRETLDRMDFLPCNNCCFPDYLK